MVYSNQLYPAKPTFKTNKEPNNARDYVLNKSASTTFCNTSCPAGRLTGTNYQKLYALRTATRIKKNVCIPTFNNTDLNINLFTKMNLQNVSVLNSSGVIDPNGVLFGNTECGMNNFENFLVPYYPSF